MCGRAPCWDPPRCTSRLSPIRRGGALRSRSRPQGRHRAGSTQCRTCIPRGSRTGCWPRRLRWHRDPRRGWFRWCRCPLRPRRTARSAADRTHRWHCTGQTSTQARSFTSMHASVMIARPAMGQLLTFFVDRPDWPSAGARPPTGGEAIRRRVVADEPVAGSGRSPGHQRSRQCPVARCADDAHRDGARKRCRACAGDRSRGRGRPSSSVASQPS